MFIYRKILLGLNPTKALGGSITYDGSYAIHTFTTNDTFELFANTVADILVVAGGGGGGLGGGGGGAGGVIYQQGVSLSANNYSVAIGNGGAPGVCINCATFPVIQTPGSNGSNSLFGGLYTAIGGGGGGSHNTGSNFSWNSNPNGRTYDDGVVGGSGGGAAFNWAINSLGGCTRPVGAFGTAGQGNAGGNSCLGCSNCDNPRQGGGGGGAGGAGGGDGATPNGGIGRLINITGTSTYYGGGGGGYGQNGNGVGGLGGGGSYGVLGTANTGGGGGGNAYGGSGIVIVRYLR